MRESDVLGMEQREGNALPFDCRAITPRELNSELDRVLESKVRSVVVQANEALRKAWMGGLRMASVRLVDVGPEVMRLVLDVMRASGWHCATTNNDGWRLIISEKPIPEADQYH